MTASINPERIPSKTLFDGGQIPCIGMGTFGSDKYSATEIGQAVFGGIQDGYRLFDCASVYGNEKEIGAAFRSAFSKKVVHREDLFIMSKVWNNMHGRGKVTESCEQTLKDLGLDVLDAYYVHWPFPNFHAPYARHDSRNPDSRPFSKEHFMAVWQEMESLYHKGLVRYLGMSNMTVNKLTQVLPLCQIKPALLEMELHPSFQQQELFDYALAAGIQPIGYSPIGSPSRPERDRTPHDLSDIALDEIVQIAFNHGVHPAVVCLKWAVQRGQIPIPFAVREVHYLSNLRGVVEDPLTQEEMDIIASLERGNRLIKGQVFLWEGATDWREIWDEQ